jgi:tetratricopeptide (TPR) repeat protein
MAETCEAWVAKIVSVQGSVEARRVGETQWQPVRLHETYCPGDALRVQEHSRAAIVLPNEAILRLDQKTIVTFATPESARTSLLDLLTGAVYFFSRMSRSLKITTPFVNAAVEGTEFFVQVEHEHTLLAVFAGQVAATNAAGSLTLGGGQAAIARAEQAPALQVVVRPRHAVQWALYYPPILDYRPDDFPGETGWPVMVRQSMQFYRDGDLPMAFASTAPAPEDIREPRFFTYRAALLLTVGRVDEAKGDIHRALRLDPRHSHAIALQALIAVVQNDQDAALTLAQQAVELDPTAAAARVALSYAQQARFDLQGALASLQKAVQLRPENALAWARLAELWLSVGKLKKALQAAQKAVTLHANLAHTQTVLGFAFLTQTKVREAQQAFARAIELDQAAPLPRLGLGLAQIRQGDLHEGRGEIAIAASLDPHNSLIRSYLGKAYYDEKRDKLAQDQYDIAKQLDPLDPTPWFYDAILKQSVNRPVEALQDQQKSIELNDNRAVYRSRLLLDEDLAARSATQARIYNEIGFQQRALVEGWASLNVDPSNYSAHRFLSDSYAALPRHEIARVSELLQAQLLQPINLDPIQPQLAESALFILRGAGPAVPSLNEFNPLFNRNRFALLASGAAGGRDTWGDEVVISGIANRLSYSAGQFHYETDGFRPNNDLEHNIYNVFLQAEIAYNASVQAEFRHTNIDSGDITRPFFPGLVSPDFRETVRAQSVRLGFRYGLAPHSDIITSLIYGHLEDDIAIGSDDDVSSEDSYTAEVQHLWRSKRLHVTSGVGYSSINLKEMIAPPPERSENDIRHINIYTYVQLQVLNNVALTLGGSADFFQDDNHNHNQFNPKLGVIWNPFPGTVLRAAVFRLLKRRVITNQTIEPTQIAGFNQFFDDINRTDAWRYGIAFDQKFSPGLYAGAEFSKRHLDVPTEVEELERKEWLTRAYLYWTPSTWLALNVEYLYEELQLDPEALNELNTADVKTHRLSTGVGFFHPSGFSARLQATYIDQEGKFRQGNGDIAPGDDQFWVADASLWYRLPKRWGLLSIEMKNLFDQKFRFQDTDPANPTISLARFVLGRFTLAF